MSKLCVSMWETASKLLNQSVGKFNCKDLFLVESEIACYTHERLSIKTSENKGRGLFVQGGLQKGELVIAGTAVATGKST